MTKGEESRQRLIKCAAELFWKNGYSATGISQILRQTGLPKLSARTTGRNFAGCPYAVMGMETALSRPNITSAFMDALTCSLHLNLTDFEVGGSCSIALQGKAKTGYPRVSRGSFLSGYGSFLCYYAHFLYILFPSFRILTAAFTSRSIRFPHSHRYIRSDNASSFFLCPHTLHILLDAKYLSTFIRYFPRSSSLYPSMERN